MVENLRNGPLDPLKSTSNEVRALTAVLKMLPMLRTLVTGARAAVEVRTQINQRLSNTIGEFEVLIAHALQEYIAGVEPSHENLLLTALHQKAASTDDVRRSQP